MEVVNNPILNILGQVLNVSSRRAGLVASNVANIDTPGYKAQTFDFEGALASITSGSGGLQLARTDSGHLAPKSNTGSFVETEESEAPARQDGNNVDIERELSDLLKSELMFKASLRLIARKIGMLNSAISEGR
ncbi:flagellar basal body rod protein FlgB [bacterium]|nr:flagellar basal body rod protein FlgB [bacterium]